MSVAQSDYQQVRAAQEKMDAEKDDLIASLMDSVLFTQGAFSYHDLLAMEPHDIQIMIDRFTNKLEMESNARQAASGKKSVSL